MPSRPALPVALVVVIALIAGACGTSGRPVPSATGADQPQTTGSMPQSDDTKGGADGGPALRALPPAGGIPSVEERGPWPTAINIPGLGVEGNTVRPVGVELNGDYEVPEADEVGWYKFGSAPGEDGSSVLAAHIAYNGENGAFVDLADVEIGEQVEVSLDDGSTLVYVVTEVATYDKQALPFDAIFSETGPDRLALITCGGTFNPSLRSYESNVVAYAVPTDGD